MIDALIKNIENPLINLLNEVIKKRKLKNYESDEELKLKQNDSFIENPHI